MIKKFKAWNIRRWLRDNEWALTPSGGILYYDEKEGWFEPDAEDLKICQFTGLIDEKGKEIYEGDIVSRNGRIGRIEVGEYELLIVFNDKADKFSFYSFHKMGVEIIGNIYDTPGLIPHSS